MSFAGIQEPITAPTLTYAKRQIKTAMTRFSATHSGYRVISSHGSSDNLMDIDNLELPILLPEQVTQLEGYFKGIPGVFCIRLGSNESTQPIYKVVFKESGLKIENYKYNQRCFSKAKLDMYVVNSTSSVTFH